MRELKQARPIDLGAVTITPTEQLSITTVARRDEVARLIPEQTISELIGPKAFKKLEDGYLNERQGTRVKDDPSGPKKTLRTWAKEALTETNALRKDLAAAYRNDASPEEIAGLKEKIFEARKNAIEPLIRYARLSYGKVALRPGFEADASGAVPLTAFQVTAPLYFGLSNQGMNPTLQQFAMGVGASAIIETADTPKKLVVQFRDPVGNRQYGGVPGASIAGMVDASRHTVEDALRIKHGAKEGDLAAAKETLARHAGAIDELTIDGVFRRVFKEGKQELNLGPTRIQGVKLVGLAEDHIKPHFEVMMIAQTNLTQNEVLAAARSHYDRKVGGKEFPETAFVIDATPRAIEALVSEVKCPLPPTHNASFVAAGRAMVEQQSGSDAAEEWVARVAANVAKNYAEISRTVLSHYLAQPDPWATLPKNMRELVADFSKKNSVDFISADPESVRSILRTMNEQGAVRSWYDPGTPATQQGLPDLFLELKRLHEPLGYSQPHYAYRDTLFSLDIDGVLVDPNAPEEMVSALIASVADLANRNYPIVLNTGRDAAWFTENILPALREKIQSPEAWGQILVMCEKGMVAAYIDPQSRECVSSCNAEYMCVPELRDNLRRYYDTEILPNGKKLSDIAALSADRASMVSLIKHDHVAQQEFDAARGAISASVEEIMRQQSITSMVLDHTTIAIDIQHVLSGKDLGTRRAVETFSRAGVKVSRLIGVGDSPSDAAMAKGAIAAGIEPSEILIANVGTSPMQVEPGVMLTHTDGRYTKGTEELFNSFVFVDEPVAVRSRTTRPLR